MAATLTRPVLGDLVATNADVWLRRALLLVAGVAALTISAKVQIASVPVPVTLQMLVVMVVGAAYGPRLGASTVLSYLALGFAGAPVFAGAVAGPTYFLGPTGGYLIGFALAAFTVGHLARLGWDRSPLTMAAAMIAGLLAVYVPGVVWLSASWGAALGWENWFAWGVWPFIWIDAVKLLVAVLAFPTIWKLVGDARA